MRNNKSNAILRILCTILAFAMLFGLVSCKKKYKDPSVQFVAALDSLSDKALENADKNSTSVPSADIAKLDGKKTAITLQPVLSDTLAAMIGAELPVDISVINNLKVGIDGAVKGDLAKLGLSLGYANSSLIALSGILDTKTLGAYINISEGTDKTLFFDLKSLTDGLDQDMIEQATKSVDIPAEDIKELIPVLTEYFKMIYSGANGVTKVDNTVAVGDLSAEMTVLTWTATDKEVYDIAIAIVEKFVADDRIKPLVEPFYQGEEDFDEAYSEIVETAKDFLEIEKNDPTETTGAEILTVRLYVDKNNDIFGFDAIAYESDGAEVLNVNMGSLKVGDAFAFEMTATGEEFAKIAVSANGTNVKDVVNATVTASYDGKQVAVLTLKDCDNSKADKGITKGSVHLKPGSGLASLPDMDPSTAIAIGMFGLKIDFETAENKTDMFISVEMNNVNLAGVKLTVENGEAEAITVPSDYISDPTVWVMSLDFNKILTALDNSELPDEIVNMIRALLSQQ